MARYIDAKRIRYCWMIDADGAEHDGVTLQSIIDKIPTADVAPRAEVAREIFEEIEKLTFAYGFGGDIPNLAVMTRKDFEDLKKKYAEGTK